MKPGTRIRLIFALLLGVCLMLLGVGALVPDQPGGIWCPDPGIKNEIRAKKLDTWLLPSMKEYGLNAWLKRTLGSPYADRLVPAEDVIMALWGHKIPDEVALIRQSAETAVRLMRPGAIGFEVDRQARKVVTDAGFKESRNQESGAGNPGPGAAQKS